VSVQERLRAILATSSGIELPFGSTQALDAFVDGRCRALGLAHTEEYLGFLAGSTSSEFQLLVNAVTVKYTWFFRDQPQLESIRRLMAEPREGALHVWVPGCASGEDAYTVALLAWEVGADVRVLGTDICSDAVARARRGHYGAWSTRDVPPSLQHHFVRAGGGTLTPTPALRSRVTFEVHNVLAPPPLPPSGRGWDIILCRNVLMYFAQERAQATAGVLARALCEDGFLLLGASDVLIEPPEGVSVDYVADRVVLRRGTPGVRLPGIPGAHARVESVSGGDAVRGVELVPVIPAPVPVAPALEKTAFAVTSVEPTLQAAHAYLSAGKIELAVRAYTAAREAAPVASEPHLYGGIALYLSGDLSRAVESLRAALLLDHQCWPASYYLGLCYESMGYPRDAAREYERAAKQSEIEPSTEEDASSPLFGFRRDLAWLARQRGRKPARHQSP
jgi:chemotaxis protein methyltransferase CheR